MPKENNTALYLRIADFILGVKYNTSTSSTKYETVVIPRIRRKYAAFICKKPSKIDFWIIFETKQNYDILKRFKKQNFILYYQKISNKKIKTFGHISDFQFQLIIRDVCQMLLSKNKGLILHASASLIDDKAFIFLGNSGAGKSTTVETLSPKYPIIADDMLILRKIGETCFVYQTPFQEKNPHYKKSSKSFPLKYFFFLKRAQTYKIRKITNRESILENLINQIFSEQDDIANQIKFALELAANSDNFYQLSFPLGDMDKLVNLLKTHGLLGIIYGSNENQI